MYNFIRVILARLINRGAKCDGAYNRKSASKQAIAVLMKMCFMFTGFLMHLQNLIVNQIHFITFGGGYIWEGRLEVDRPITWRGVGVVGLQSILSSS